MSNRFFVLRVAILAVFCLVLTLNVRLDADPSLDSGARYQGTLVATVIEHDGADAADENLDFFLITEQGKSLSLIRGNSEVDLNSYLNKQVIVTGSRSGETLNFKSLEEVPAEPSSSSSSSSSTTDSYTAEPALYKSPGVKILIVDISFANGPSKCTHERIDKLFFTGEHSVSNYFNTVSFGQISLERDTDGNGQPDIVSVTIPAVDESFCRSGERRDIWTTKATEIARSQLKGVVDFSKYQAIYYLYAPHPTHSCNGGWGFAGCLNERSGYPCSGALGFACGYSEDREVIFNYNTFQAIHEIGHMMGLHHSSSDYNNDSIKDQEYGDSSCPMGTGFNRNTFFNAPQMVRAGWLQDSEIQDVYTAGEYEVNPMAIPRTDSVVPKVLRVRSPVIRPRGSRERVVGPRYYYFSVRKTIGEYDVNTHGRNKVSVHSFGGFNIINPYIVTYLGEGESFTDPSTGATFVVKEVYEEAGRGARIQVITSPENPDLRLAYDVKVNITDKTGNLRTPRLMSRIGVAGIEYSRSRSRARMRFQRLAITGEGVYSTSAEAPKNRRYLVAPRLPQPMVRAGYYLRPSRAGIVLNQNAEVSFGLYLRRRRR